MSIARVNPILPDTGSQASARSSGEAAADYAAVARSVAAGDLEAARKALAAAAPAAGGATDTLAQTLAEGNLAAARLALAQLGAQPFPTSQAAVAPGRDVTIITPPPSTPTRDASIIAPAPPAAPRRDATIIEPAPQATRPDMKIAPVPPQPNVVLHGLTIADVGATAATSSATAGVPAGATVTSASGQTYAVADVMLALALGNAGSIPADVINLYGPGGARYDPAAIMDAYRNSALGKAQIAALSWVGRPA